MPYIPQHERPWLDELAEPLLDRIDTEGQLVYVLYKLCYGAALSSGGTFAQWNAVTGALESTKLELYRQWIATYEDNKLDENGDVYFTSEEAPRGDGEADPA